MLNMKNTLTATFICVTINVAYTFYSSTSAFVKRFSNSEQELGRIESFIYASGIIEDFWPHVVKAWVHGFGLSLIPCLLLLLWLQYQTPKKASQPTPKSGATEL